MSEQKNKQSVPPTVITLTLQAGDEAPRSGTLLVARGDLAHLQQFTYDSLNDLAPIIKDGFVALARIEADPPKNSAKSVAPAKGNPKPTKTDDEPTVDVPLKKGKVAVKVSSLKIVGGESDAAAYRQAVLVASRLIDGQLWDGQTPIRIDDVYKAAGKLKHLTDRDLSMFTLTDFVQVGEVNTPSDAAENADRGWLRTPSALPRSGSRGGTNCTALVQSSIDPKRRI